MNSFYGGPNGRSFYIKEIFTSYHGSTNSIDSDLERGWTSPIGIGDFVVISYGIPGDENFDKYRQIDLDYEQKSYNSTLWQKLYNENEKSANGIYYKLIAAMVGNTPRISINQPIEILNADEDPKVRLDASDIDLPVFYFSLPQSQVIKIAEIEGYLNVNQKPEVRLDGDVNRPVLKFKLPVSQEILPQNVLYETIDADDEPYVIFNNTNVNNPTLTFYLPQSQIMQQPTITTVGPDNNPSVTLNSTDVNKPKLQFTLPRAVKFYYGSLLGKRANSTYTETNSAFSGYAVGDYYINAETGFIYKVISVNGTTATFEYQACIQSPLPEILNTSISPYTEDKNPRSPKVVKNLLNAEGTAWQLDFQLPRMPKPEIGYESLPSVKTGEASVEIKDENTIKFNFKVPAGSRWFFGSQISEGQLSTVVSGAKTGDFYINSETGVVYSLQESGSWKAEEGSLRGPAGKALNIVRSFDIRMDSTHEDSLDTGVNWIQENYGGPYTSDMIFAITFIESNGDSSTYWYYYAQDGKWSRALLTGGVGNLIETTYNNESDGAVENKAYSVHYINSLIGDTGNENQTTFSKAKITEMVSWGSFSDLI